MMIASSGKDLVILGLERGNLDRLQQGQPMQISAESHPGFPLDATIVIVFAETPRDLVALVKPFMDDTTKVVAVPKEKGQPS